MITISRAASCGGGSWGVALTSAWMNHSNGGKTERGCGRGEDGEESSR